MKTSTDLQREMAEGNIKVVATVQELCAQEARATVTNQDLLDRATDLAAFMKNTKRKIEDERRSWTDPLKKQIDRINEGFRKMTVPLDLAYERLKKKIETYQREQYESVKERTAAERANYEQQTREEIELLRSASVGALNAGHKDRAETLRKSADDLEKHITGVIEIDDSARRVRKGRGSLGGTSYVREEWTVEVLDKGKVPLEFINVDGVRILNAFYAYLKRARRDGELRGLKGSQLNAFVERAAKRAATTMPGIKLVKNVGVAIR